ncbi:MAG: polysaccharide biosynthesis/export family protein [Phocaeicola sp.]
MKKRTALLTLLLLSLLASSCNSYKQVPYLQNAESCNTAQDVYPLYDARIMPKDLLTILVSTTDPLAATPFNLTVPTGVNGESSLLQEYLVNNNGEIQFPVLGTLQLAGLTKGEAEQLIIDRLKNYLKETPIVTVRMTNYKISVMGEVGKPGTFTINNEKVNIFEALAMAGDLTIYGKRQDMKLIREDAKGQRTIHTIDLTQADLINSPYYHLQQNDVLYITPNKTKAKNSDISSSTTIWFTVLSSLLSVTNLLITVLR